MESPTYSHRQHLHSVDEHHVLSSAASLIDEASGEVMCRAEGVARSHSVADERHELRQVATEAVERMRDEVLIKLDCLAS